MQLFTSYNKKPPCDGRFLRFMRCRIFSDLFVSVAISLFVPFLPIFSRFVPKESQRRKFMIHFNYKKLYYPYNYQAPPKTKKIDLSPPFFGVKYSNKIAKNECYRLTFGLSVRSNK